MSEVPRRDEWTDSSKVGHTGKSVIAVDLITISIHRKLSDRLRGFLFCHCSCWSSVNSPSKIRGPMVLTFIALHPVCVDVNCAGRTKSYECNGVHHKLSRRPLFAVRVSWLLRLSETTVSCWPN